MDRAVWQEVGPLLPHPERLAEAYRRRLQPETRAKHTPLAPMEDQSSKGRQGVARLIDSAAASLLDQAACEPRMTRLRQRLARLEAQRQALAAEAALHGELQLIMGRLEDGATQLHDGLETADWASKRDRIRALVKRVEGTRNEVNVVLRSDPYPRENDPEKKSWQLCRGREASSLWRARVCWREEAPVDNSCLQPLTSGGGAYGQCGQQGAMSTMVKAAADIGVESPWTAGLVVQRPMEGFDRIHRAAPWPKAIGVGFKACLPCWLKGRLDDGLHHPVLAGWSTPGSLLTVVLRDVHPSDGSRLVPLKAQALLQHSPAGFWGVVHHSVNACRVLALVCLRDPPDGQERVGRGSNQQFLKVFHPLPCLVRGGARDPFLQASSIAFHSVPVEVSPGGVGVVCGPCSAGYHRLTSPKIRTLLAFSPVRTRRKSAPFRVG